MLLKAIIMDAQTLFGSLVDEKGKPISFANIVLLSLPDTIFLSGTISDEAGMFSLEIPTDAHVLCRISSVGYQTICNENHGGGNWGTICLADDTQLLGEVTVKGYRPQTRMKGDAMVTKVEGTILEKAGTANDLLSKIPNVSTEDGVVEVFGRGTAEIYINGRQMRNTSELEQLSSEQIKSVEVVSNPGARYNASAKAIVRIVTQKKAGDGFGLANRTVTRHRRTYGWSTFDQIDLHYNTNRFDLSGMLYGGVFRSGNNQRIVMKTHLDKLWQQEMDATYAKTRSDNLAGNLSLNYQFHEKHSIGMRYGTDHSTNTDGDWRYHSQVFCDGELYEKSDSQMLTDTPSQRNEANLYYNGQVNEWHIDFNADGLWNKTKEEQHTTERINENEERRIQTFNENKGNLYASRLTASHPLWQGTLSLGGEYSHTERTNLYQNFEGILSDDDSKIKEGSVSGFADYTCSFRKVSVQAGIRYERVKFDYYEAGKHIDIQSRRFNNIFPSLNVTFLIGKAQFRLGYSEDITRPSYNNLRNNTYYANRYTYQTGNPFLTPTLTRNLLAAASYRWLNLSVGYSHVRDDMMQMSEAYSEETPTISLLKVVNMPAYDRIAASVTLAPTFGFWHPRLAAQIYKQWLSMDGVDEKISLNKPICTLTWRNNFSLPANIMADVDVVYNTYGTMQNMYQQKNAYNISFSLYKSFCKKRLTIQMQANNLLETANYDALIYSGIRTMTDYITTFRQCSFTLRYKFNQAQSRYKGTGAGKSQKSRM
ncbi:MAG: TonB-dependent receptor [Phocaeicola sp.]|nr:TonB-dependent receptor [Phocaeicola sp.]